MPRPLKRIGGAVWLAATAVMMAMACSPPAPAPAHAPRAVEYLDPVADGRLTSRAGPALRCCADETYWALRLDRGEEISVGLQLAEEPVLTLSVGQTAGWRAGRLVCTVIADDDPGDRLETELRPEPGWSTSTIDLARFTGRSVQLRLKFEVHHKYVKLLVREVVVRQRVDGAPPPTDDPARVLLVSLDTLRWDAQSLAGGEGLMPNLARLAAEAELFESHYATACWTKPSHASMLTGHHPATHGATDDHRPIHPALPTLAQRFRDHGLATGALVYDCLWLDPRWGFDRGFDSYQVVKWRVDRQFRAAVNWLAGHRSEPFFFFLHTFEPHSDIYYLQYEAPGLTREAMGDRTGLAGAGCREDVCGSQLLQAFNRKELEPLPGEPEMIHDQYREGVRATDLALGRLIDDLKASGLWDALTLVVTSDHGEEFGERGRFLHSTVYDTVIRVPLLVKWPGGRNGGVRHRGPTSAVDLAPSLLRLAGVDHADLPGRLLGRRPASEPVVSGTSERAIVLEGMKALRGRDRRWRLYDLEADPAERKNLALDRPELLQRMKKILNDEVRGQRELRQSLPDTGRAAPVESITDEERDRLRALGYLD
jgi:arylsulfatase A-like enzyme